jgi:hypothetical protein
MGTRILDDKDCGGDTLYPEKTRIVEETHTLYPERYVVVGSWREQRYQQALVIIMYRRSKNLKLEFKVEHEQDIFS